jgi:two-component system, NarL family, response regulator FusR
VKPPRLEPLRVRLVDDHALVLAGYARLLAQEPDIAVVGQHPSAEAAYDALLTATDATDVLMLDLSMPGRGGFELLRQVRHRWPTLAQLVCTMHDSRAVVQQALQAGANGVITKASDPVRLPEALHAVARGHRWLSPDISQHAVAARSGGPHHETLSPREFDVLRRLAQGDGIEQIADALSLAPKTVANLQTQIKSKLGLTTAVDLVRYAQAWGLDA